MKELELYKFTFHLNLRIHPCFFSILVAIIYDISNLVIVPTFNVLKSL
jgi:hypothetical protein